MVLMPVGRIAGSVYLLKDRNGDGDYADLREAVAGEPLYGDWLDAHQ